MYCERRAILKIHYGQRKRGGRGEEEGRKRGGRGEEEGKKKGERGGRGEKEGSKRGERGVEEGRKKGKRGEEEGRMRGERGVEEGRKKGERGARGERCAYPLLSFSKNDLAKFTSVAKILNTCRNQERFCGHVRGIRNMPLRKHMYRVPQNHRTNCL